MRVLSREEFYSRFVNAGQPVLLYGDDAFGGSAKQEWTKAKFTKTWGEQHVLVVASHRVVLDQVNFKEGKQGQTQKTRLRDFIETEMGHSGEQAVESPRYLFKQNQFHNITAYIQPPRFFDSKEDEFRWSQAERGRKSLFFIGPTHSGTTWHSHSSTWNAVVVGRKRWLMMPPQSEYKGKHEHDEVPSLRKWLANSYEEYENGMLECVQEAGTVLYIPDGWGHATVNLEDSIGIAVEVGTAPLADLDDQKLKGQPG
jgi:hypothetical protein